jgi:acyl-CoA thioester hydrolase
LIDGAAAGGAFRFHHSAEVRFRDLDPMGHAHHSTILIYIEEARAAYWRKVAGRATVGDIDYVMADASLQFRGRIFYPGRIEVGVRVSRLGRSSFGMEYELRSAAGELLATAQTTQVMYDYGEARSKPIPQELRERLERWESAGG